MATIDQLINTLQRYKETSGGNVKVKIVIFDEKIGDSSAFDIKSTILSKETGKTVEFPVISLTNVNYDNLHNISRHDINSALKIDFF